MRVQFGDEVIGVADRHRIDDPRMGFERVDPVGRVVVVERPVRFGRVPEQAHDPHRVGLVGRFQHGEVEAAVGLELGGDVAALDRLLAVPGRQRDPLVGVVVELG